MARKCLLFTYGLLQPGQRGGPRSVSQSWPDRVPGRLYDLGDFPAARDLGRAETWVAGLTLEIDELELPELDAFEDVDSGEFARVLIETERGFLAWAYEYRWEIPTGLVARERWR